jgi:hypothetical protein
MQRLSCFFEHRKRFDGKETAAKGMRIFIFTDVTAAFSKHAEISRFCFALYFAADIVRM